MAEPSLRPRGLSVALGSAPASTSFQEASARGPRTLEVPRVTTGPKEVSRRLSAAGSPEGCGDANADRRSRKFTGSRQPWGHRWQLMKPLHSAKPATGAGKHSGGGSPRISHG